MQALQAATACGYVLAAELRACRVDMSFAPVLDLDYGSSSVIGDRAARQRRARDHPVGQEPDARPAASCLAHCGKHFPGHGHVRADSHVDIPVDRRSLRAILRNDALPYQWLASTLAAVMPAHVIYSKVDEARARARQVQGQPLSLSEAALAALAAGCDLALVCNQSLDGGRARSMNCSMN